MNKNTDIRQLPLAFEHQPFLGKEDFMVASCNAEAFAYVENWPDWPFFAVWPGRLRQKSSGSHVL